MCVQTQLHDHSTRITALEAQHYAPEDLVAIKAEIARISAYLFGLIVCPLYPEISRMW